jgi:hypothetical protein
VAEPVLIKTFTGRVLATRNAAHIAHWKSPRYGMHVALDEFYTEILDQVDEIVEIYQGSFGLIGEIEIPIARPTSILDHITGECAWIKASRDEISGGDQAIANKLDEMCAVYMRTAYKLKHLV